MTRRALSEPCVAAPPRAVSIRTRLLVSPVDEQVLRAVGDHLGSLLRSDLAARCSMREGYKHQGRAERKKELTAQSSSRWAGSITRRAGDMWERAFKNLEDLAERDRREIRALDRRLAVPVGTGKGKSRGYATRSERFGKQRRRQRLAARLADTKQRLSDGTVSVVVGGKRLLRNRHNLEEAGITETEWRHRWETRRMFLTADGEAGKAWGNETIRVAPHAEDTCTVTVRLPTPLRHLSNTAGRAPTYRLSSPIRWNHRVEEWREHASSDQAVGYTIRFNSENGRWYISASWSLPYKEERSLEELRRSSNCLAVDVNSDHLAARVLGPHGNPIGRPIREELAEQGPSSHRLGILREAVSQLVKHAKTQGVTTIAIERLDFTTAVGKNNPRQRRGKPGKVTRRKTCGIPTSKFSLTIASAAYRHNLAVIAVDPAYTSKWGQRWWKAPLDRSRRQRGDRH